MTTDDDRVAFLAGEGSVPIDDDERRELEELRGMLSAPETWSEPAPELEDAVVAAVVTEAASQSTDPRPLAGRPVRSRWYRPAAFIGAAAAAVALVVATAVLTTDGGDSSEQLAADLGPTGVVPEAAGQATLIRTDSGWRIELDASGLPRLEDGRFYQAWLEGQGGLVAVGSFNEARDVVLWAGVSPHTHPRLTITEERADGDASSSGREVLAGNVTED